MKLQLKSILKHILSFKIYGNITALLAIEAIFTKLYYRYK